MKYKLHFKSPSVFGNDSLASISNLVLFSHQESEKQKWKSLSHVRLCDPLDYTVHGILQARILEWVAFPSPGDLPNPGIEPRSPALQVDSLPAESQGKPKNTGVGSLSPPSPVALLNPGIEPGTPALQADSLPTNYLGSLY